MKTEIFTIVKYIIAFAAGLLIVPIILLLAILIYCDGFVEKVRLIDQNNLRNQSEVYDFVTQNLTLQVDDISATQNFILENQMDCSAVLPRSETTRFIDINFNSLIACTFPVHRASFLNINYFILGRLNVCYFTPRLRIIFLFDSEEKLTEVYMELLLYGL